MKKEYIRPTIEILNIEPLQIMAGSDGISFDNGNARGHATLFNDDYAEDEAW